MVFVMYCYSLLVVIGLLPFATYRSSEEYTTRPACLSAISNPLLDLPFWTSGFLEPTTG